MYTVVWLPFPSPGSAWSHPVPLPAAPRVHPPPPPRSRSPCVQQFAPFLWICPFWTFYRKWPSMGTTLPALPPVATGWQQRSPLVRGRPHCACRVWGLWGGGRSPSLGSGPRAGADGVPLLVSPTPGPSGTPSAPQPGFLGGRGRGRTPPAPEAQLPRGLSWAQGGRSRVGPVQPHRGWGRVPTGVAAPGLSPFLPRGLPCGPGGSAGGWWGLHGGRPPPQAAVGVALGRRASSPLWLEAATSSWDPQPREVGGLA